MPSYRDFGIELRKESGSGREYTTCPKCSHERKKSRHECLTVWFDTESWKCFQCGWYGSLARGEENKSNPNYHKESRNEWRRPEKRKVIKIPTLEQEMFGWFEKRGISQGTVEAFGIWVEQDVWISEAQMRMNAIRFPYFRNGELINVKSRAQGKKMCMEIGAERIFFGLDTLLVGGGVAQQVFITEGEPDALVLWEAGYRHVLSVPNGAPSEKTKNLQTFFDFIANSNYKRDGQKVGILEEVRTFYLAVDSDGPGKKLEEELTRRLGAMIGPERILRVQWPEVVE